MDLKFILVSIIAFVYGFLYGLKLIQYRDLKKEYNKLIKEHYKNTLEIYIIKAIRQLKQELKTKDDARK